ncbi:type I restriction enzyme S subunit [Micromonospora sp. A202]|uniref:restriction endonuclease subunit S n=1 Tax=Micromonospora sp. A202 TaxID=2572899 RepID=UPI0011504056|nr:restriction endonuclease subunit S [Micromonospora sp. A202]TQJ23806.1 type I restriction enzyme S subunit [Micromonospora sp. A202]
MSVLGSIDWPETWRAVPLWSLFDRVKDVGHPDEEMLSVYRDYGIVKKDSRSDNGNKTAENREIYQLVDSGWLVINRMKAWQGSVGISSYRGIISGHYVCFRPKHHENAQFLNWLLRSDVYTVEYLRLSRGVRPNQVEIDNDGLRILPVWLPPIEAQQAIANFLVRETAKIDAIITKQQGLVTTLLEHRASLITEAIAELIHGGTQQSRLKYHAEIQTGVTLGKTLDEEASRYPYLRVANVQTGYVDLAEVKEVALNPGDLANYLLRPGDVLMTEGGDIDKLGRGCIWEGQIDPCVHQNHIFAVRCHPSLINRFLVYLLESDTGRRYFRATAKRTTNLASTNSTNVGNLPIPVPTVDEQRAIADRLDIETRRIDTLLDKTRQLIGIMKERRRGWIAACVTGQVDIATYREGS